MLERSSVRDSTPKPWKLRLILKTRTTRTRRRTERKPSSAVAPAAITTRSTYHGRIATRSMRLSVCSTKARRRIASPMVVEAFSSSLHNTTRQRMAHILGLWQRRMDMTMQTDSSRAACAA